MIATSRFNRGAALPLTLVTAVYKASLNEGLWGEDQAPFGQIARNNPKAKTAKPEQFFDNTLVQELINEGFYAKLWGRNP